MAAAAVPRPPQPRPAFYSRPLFVTVRDRIWEEVPRNIVVPIGADVANINHRSTTLNTDGRLIPPRNDMPCPIEWGCPKYLGIWNCIVCITKKGIQPAGIHIDREKIGLSSVSAVLLQGGQFLSCEKVAGVIVAHSLRKRRRENSFRMNGAPLGMNAFLTTNQLEPFDKAGEALALDLSPIVKALVDLDGAIQDIRNLDFVPKGVTRRSIQKMWDHVAYALKFIDCDSISARCMLTKFSLFATAIETSILRMLHGFPDVSLSGPIKNYILKKGGRFHLRWEWRQILYDKVADGSVYEQELAMSKATQKQLLKADVYVAEEGGTSVIVQLAGFASKLVAEEAVGGLWNLLVDEVYNGVSAKAAEWRHSTILLCAKQHFGAFNQGGEVSPKLMFTMLFIVSWFPP